MKGGFANFRRTNIAQQEYWICPVCGWDGVRGDPYDQNYDICSCCFTEFGNDHAFHTYVELREQWIKNGMKWHSRHSNPPEDWNPLEQLKRVQ